MDLTELQRIYPSITFVNTNFLDNKTLKMMSEKYSKMEYAYALTPFAIKYLLSNFYAQVLFLKLETLVLGDIEQLFIELNLNSAIVTPHLFPRILIISPLPVRYLLRLTKVRLE